ncbi:MAG: murein biosynthesis integral membrane protein MurJ [Bryobacterales bacterium]|nr:murein biosynthesis integral membrane protein MurJ [Bryobacterales bacterium]
METAAHGVVRHAGIMSAAVMLSRITGLAREIIMARLFGAGVVFEAFRLGFLLPNLTRDLFAEGALSAAFVPTFTDYLTTRGKNEAVRLANLVATAIILFIGLLCIGGAVFAPQLVDIFAPGFRQVPGKFELAVHLTRIMFPFLLLVALAAQAMGILNACNQFAVPALASSFFNVGSVSFGLMLGFWIGPHLGLSAIEGMAWGVVLGGALQLFWQAPSLLRSGFSFRPAIDWSHPGLRHIIHLMGPAILGGAAVQINVMVNTNFASYVSDPLRGPNGPVSWLGWAFRFFQLPLGLFGVAVANATLPTISRSLASNDFIEFRRTLSRSLAVVFLLTVPSSAGLMLLGSDMIAAIYQGGKFDAYDTQQTALALSCYAIGLAGYAAAKVLTPAFYALRDSRTPMLTSLASIAVNFGVAWYSVQHTRLGHAGLALSTSAVALCSCLLLFVRLRGKAGGVYGRDLFASTTKILAATVLMSAVVWVVDHLIDSGLGTGKLTSVISLAICIPIGLAVFWAACKWFRVAELELAAAGFAGPFRRLRRLLPR